MTNDDKIREEKLKYDINRKTAKIAALSSAKINKYEYFTGKEMLLSNRRQIIEQARFTNSPLGQALEKKTEKQVDALKSLNFSNKPNGLEQIEDIFQKHLLNDQIIYKVKKIIQLQDITKSNKLDYTLKCKSY